MLFDLRGKRRRAVQATYLSLAVLMGLGLVGFGIGSDVSGGLADIFTGEDSVDESDANKEVQKRIDTANQRLKANPRDEAALIQLIRGHFALASGDADEQGVYNEDGKEELGKADAAWKKYVALKPEKPDLTMAQLMMQVYGQNALNKPKEGTEAAEIVATERNDASSYIQLLQFATLAGQQRKADLAAEKALELTPADQRKELEQQIESFKKQSQQAPPEGGAEGGATPPVQPGG
jgi:hypothetical protein